MSTKQKKSSGDMTAGISDPWGDVRQDLQALQELLTTERKAAEKILKEEGINLKEHRKHSAFIGRQRSRLGLLHFSEGVEHPMKVNSGDRAYYASQCLSYVDAANELFGEIANKPKREIEMAFMFFKLGRSFHGGEVGIRFPEVERSIERERQRTRSRNPRPRPEKKEARIIFKNWPTDVRITWKMLDRELRKKGVEMSESTVKDWLTEFRKGKFPK